MEWSRLVPGPTIWLYRIFYYTGVKLDTFKKVYIRYFKIRIRQVDTSEQQTHVHDPNTSTVSTKQINTVFCSLKFVELPNTYELVPCVMKNPNDVLLAISRAALWFAESRCISAVEVFEGAGRPARGTPPPPPLAPNSLPDPLLLCPCFSNFFCRSSSWKVQSHHYYFHIKPSSY